jgi:hypothetical protein
MNKENNIKLNCVKWVREIRDKNYEKYKHLGIRKAMDKLAEDAKKSALYMELKKRNNPKLNV